MLACQAREKTDHKWVEVIDSALGKDIECGGKTRISGPERFID